MRCSLSLAVLAVCALTDWLFDGRAAFVAIGEGSDAGRVRIATASVRYAVRPFYTSLGDRPSDRPKSRFVLYAWDDRMRAMAEVQPAGGTVQGGVTPCRSAMGRTRKMMRRRRGLRFVAVACVAIGVASMLFGLGSVPARAGVAATCGPGMPATIVGTPGDDVLAGTAGPDVIAGLGGDDVIRGGAGADVICGGRGHDILLGGVNRARRRGRGGRPWGSRTAVQTVADDVMGGRGDDVVRGGRGLDFLRDGPGDDQVYGGRGDDWITASRGHDKYRGGSGEDLVDFFFVARFGPITANLTSGRAFVAHSIARLWSIRNLLGGRAADTLIGNAVANKLVGDAGNDTIYGRAGKDKLAGGPGTDRLNGGPGIDSCITGEATTNCE
jgi:Ca2+-binding RTX toxin-like protein